MLTWWQRRRWDRRGKRRGLPRSIRRQWGCSGAGAWQPCNFLWFAGAGIGFLVQGVIGGFTPAFGTGIVCAWIIIHRAALHLEARPIPLEADCMKFQPLLGWRLASTTHYNKIITGQFLHM
jgi:hypothetical protein